MVHRTAPSIALKHAHQIRLVANLRDAAADGVGGEVHHRAVAGQAMLEFARQRGA